tara:strand:+ start:29 stop:826 length:798 start_codon:yes stop_codon:yes gene_type:complete
MKDKNILLATNILFKHRLNKTGLKSLPNHLIPNNIEDAYKVQNELKILYLTLINNHIIGKKVGCTNKLAQEQLDIFEPFYGNLFSKFTENSGCLLKSSKFFKPFIEPEISFSLKKDININDAPFNLNNAKDLFDYMFPSIELVDFRFGENTKDVGIINLIMSNGGSEFYIKSNNIFKIDEEDLSNQDVSIFINQKIMETGNTNLVLNHPLNSAIWLINKLAEIGEPMLKGQFITTGTCTKAIRLEKNSHIECDFGSLGTVEFEYI